MSNDPSPTPAVDDARGVMQIGEVATRTELSLRSLRHWDAVGLLRPSGRTEGGFRLYTADDVEKILVIRRMKPLGFTLDQMSAAMRDIETLSDSSSATQQSGPQGTEAQQRLAALLADAGERRKMLEHQLSMADEFISQLTHRIQ